MKQKNILIHIIQFAAIFVLLFNTLNSQTIVILTSPNGGEVFAWDSTHTITWTFSPPPNWPYDCQLFLSTDGGETFPDTITCSVAGDTFCLWTIPHVVSTTCRILIQVDSMGMSIGCEDVSDSNFSIVQTAIKEQRHYRLKTTGLRLIALPNPFTTVTRLKILGTFRNRKSNLTIYDPSGRLVKSVKVSNSGCQLGADLIPGIYFLKFMAGKYTQMKKIIKIR